MAITVFEAYGVVGGLTGFLLSTIGALIITYTILEVPYYNYRLEV